MTLADLSAWIRASLKWVAAGVVVIILLWIAWIVIAGLSSSIFKPRGADTQFGVLDPPLFVKTHSVFKAKEIKNEANLPNADKKIDVYQFEKSGQFPEELQKKFTSFFGLNTVKKVENKGLNTWKKRTENTYLKINTTLSHFTYNRDISNDSSLFDSKVNLNKAKTVKQAIEDIKKLGLKVEKTDLDSKNPVIIYYKITKEGRSASSETSANAVQIEFFRKVEKTLTSGQAPIRILYAQGGKKILEFDFTFSPINDAGAPYPAITASQALELLKTGGSYSEVGEEFDTAVVTSVVLTYWESKFFQPYLQPIWKFSGEAQSGANKTSFETFVPAVNQTYLSLEEEQQPSSPTPPAQ